MTGISAEGVDNGADAGFEGGEAWFGGEHGAVEVGSVSEVRDVVRVGYAEATAGGDGDAIAGALDEAGDGGCAADDVRSSAGGEDAIAAAGDDVFEGLIEVRCFVEGAVEGDFERSGLRNDGACLLLVDCAVRMQSPEDDAGCAELLRGAQGFEDLIELARRIDEVAGAGAEHDVDGEAGAAHGLRDEFGRRREAADGEVGAELDAVRAGVRGEEAGVERLGAELEDGRGRHGGEAENSRCGVRVEQNLKRYCYR